MTQGVISNSGSGQPGIGLNQFVYATAAEPFSSNAMTIKVHILELMPRVPSNGNKSKVSINKGVFCNSGTCAVTGSSNATTQNYIVARVVDRRYHTHPFLHCWNTKYGSCNCPNVSHPNSCKHSSTSHLNACHHDHWHYDFPDEALGGGMIPAGTKLICFFMNGNINDCWVTRFMCDYGQGDAYR